MLLLARRVWHGMAPPAWGSSWLALGSRAIACRVSACSLLLGKLADPCQAASPLTQPHTVFVSQRATAHAPRAPPACRHLQIRHGCGRGQAARDGARTMVAFGKGRVIVPVGAPHPTPPTAQAVGTVAVEMEGGGGLALSCVHVTRVRAPGRDLGWGGVKTGLALAYMPCRSAHSAFEASCSHA